MTDEVCLQTLQVAVQLNDHGSDFPFRDLEIWIQFITVSWINLFLYTQIYSLGPKIVKVLTI